MPQNPAPIRSRGGAHRREVTAVHECSCTSLADEEAAGALEEEEEEEEPPLGASWSLWPAEEPASWTAPAASSATRPASASTATFSDSPLASSDILGLAAALLFAVSRTFLPASPRRDPSPPSAASADRNSAITKKLCFVKNNLRQYELMQAVRAKAKVSMN